MTREQPEARNLGALILAISAACATSVALAACNTTEGAGEDLEAAGESIQEEADDAN